MSEPTKFVLGEDAIPTHWVNLLPDLPGEPLPPLNPGTGQPAGPEDLTPIFPMALIMQEVSPEPEIAIPDAVRDAYRAVAADAAVPRAPARAGARHAGEDLLQVRGRLARRLAQAEHGGPAGLRERAGRDQEALDRDRRRPVGLLAGVRVRAVRARVRGVHGRLELRPEALPALDDADLGRDRAPLAVGPHAVRASRRPRTRPARSGSRSPRPSRSPRRTRTATTRSARCSTTCCCTRP